jgi:hypothetical protein
MKTIVNRVLAFVVCIIVLNCTTVNGSGSNQSRLQFSNPKMKSLTLPFKFINNLVIIPVQINNSDTLNFILDTGVSSTIVTEVSQSDSLYLENAKEFVLRGLGSSEPLNAVLSTGNKISIGKINGNNHEVYLVKNNYLKLSSKLGIKINGILGYPIFQNFVVEIDYDNQKVTFHNPLTFKRDKYKKHWESIPLVLEGTKPYIYLTIQQCNKNKKVSVKLLIDSGASHNLWLDEYSDSDICLPDCTRYTYLGDGLNGSVYGRVGRLKGVAFGKYNLFDPVVCYPDSTSAVGYRGLNSRNGSLGANILRRFNVIFDYADSTFYFKKNSFYKESFDIGMSGVEVESIVAGLPLYVISYVDSGSRAFKCGLQVGDQIITIKGQQTKYMSLTDLVKVFEGKPGKKVKITVLRNGEYIKKEFLIEKYI